MKKISCVDRLKNMLVVDNQESFNKINRLIKAELLYVLKNYFDLSAEDLDVGIDVLSDGGYNIWISGKCNNIKVAYLFN